MPEPKKEANATEEVLGAIPWSNRIPNSKDKGLLWVYDTGTAAVLYVRSKKSGSWYAQA